MFILIVKINKNIYSDLNHQESYTPPKSETSTRTLIMGNKTLGILQQWKYIQKELLQDIKQNDRQVHISR